MSYSICTRGSDLRWLLSLEQLKCGGCWLGGCTHVTRPVVLQMTNSPVSVNMAFSYEEYTDMHFVYRVCNSNATAAVVEYGLQYPWWWILDRCVFTCVHQHLQEKGSFPSVKRYAKSQIQWNVGEDENIIDMVHWSPHTRTQRISALLCVPRVRIWCTLHAEGMYLYHVSAFSILNLWTYVSSWNCAIGLTLTTIWFVTSCSPTRPILSAMGSTIQETPIYRIVIIHIELWNVTTNISAINMWFCVIGDQMIGPYIFLQCLTGDIYANFLQHELPAFLENAPLQTWWQMCYQHDGEPPRFSQVVSIWIINSHWSWQYTELATMVTGSEPIRVPWNEMKAVVSARKVNTREKLLQRILSAARSISNAAILHRVTNSLVTQVRKCIQTVGGHFEQLAWVLNGKSVTVRLTTYLNKCTILLFPF